MGDVKVVKTSPYFSRYQVRSRSGPAERHGSFATRAPAARRAAAAAAFRLHASPLPQQAQDKNKYNPRP